MKHLKYISMTLAAALIATSCSKDACPADGGTDEVPVTFTATVDYAIGTPGDDTAPAATRATSDEDDAPSRFYAQAVSADGTLSDVVEGTKNDDGSYSFTFQVFTGKEYGYMFWADNATTDDEPTDLRSVSYTMGDIAFAAKAQGTSETVDRSVTMRHVVAKVTLVTTTDVTSEYSKDISLTASCASTYNVLTASASDFSDGSASTEMDDAGLAAGSEVLTTYLIPDPDDGAVTLGAHFLTQTIDDLPLHADIHVILRGDLSESSSKWGGATKEYVEKQIDRFFNDENGNPKGTNNGDGSYGFYLPPDRISELEAVIGAIFHEKVEIRLDGLTVFRKNLEEDYLFFINYNEYSQILSIYINYNLSFVSGKNPDWLL